MNDLDEDDFDFDLDEIVKIESQPSFLGADPSQLKCSVNSSTKNSSTKEEKPPDTKGSSKPTCDNDWGSDDDSTFLEIQEPAFQSTPFPAVTTNQTEEAFNPAKTANSNIYQLKRPASNSVGICDLNRVQHSFYGEPDFHSTPLPSSVQNVKQHSNNLSKATPLAPRTSSNQLSFRQTQNSSILDIINKKNQQQIRPAFEKPKARFPGPAGVLAPIMEDHNNKLKGQHHKVTKQLLNTDGLVGWDQALAKVDLTSAWEAKKMNLQLIKRSFVPGSFRMRVPLLVVGVQKVDYPPVIQEDIRCILQDPTGTNISYLVKPFIQKLLIIGEVKGCIVKDVITTYGTQINSGSVLILRRPSILQDFPTYHVLVTVSSLFGIYSPKTGELKHCKTFNNKDLAAWLSETTDHGDVADVYIEKAKSPVKLFTSVSDVAGSHHAAGPPFHSPAPLRPPLRPHTPRPGHNPARPPSFQAPRPAAVTPHSNLARPCPAPPPRPCVRAASSSFQFKAPSAVVSTPRPAPYNPPPNRARSTTAPSSSPAANEDEFLSQFLSGVDTDALFDDF